MSGMSRQAVSGVPVWQADDQTTECCLCHTRFSLFFRRHHCRKCGRIVCGSCSSNRSTYMPATYVVSPPSQIFLESPHVPHRTCDECMDELQMIRAALRGGSSSSSSGQRRDSTVRGGGDRMAGTLDSGHGVTGRRGRRRGNQEGGVASSSKGFEGGMIQTMSMNYLDDDNGCPICGKNLAKLEEKEKELHIAKCVEQAEFSGMLDGGARRSNRMLIYQLPPNGDGSSLGECVICFEEFKPGDQVGRLECLCIYHEKCILGWFQRKGVGACPVHAVNAN